MLILFFKIDCFPTIHKKHIFLFRRKYKTKKTKPNGALVCNQDRAAGRSLKDS